ncbi:MAG: FAD binding domain-containing protein, partial [Pseudomonadota bacterium]|nr:FAD binding domain-containing protein [Pseudomonadota bacterium]
MTPFSYERAVNIDSAIEAAQQSGTRFLAGGTNLIDLVKSGVEHPQRLVDLNRLALADIVELPDGGVRIGAM